MRANLTIEDTFEMSPEAKAIREKYPDIEYAIKMEGQLRHIGKHAAGVIIGNKPLKQIMALYSKESEKGEEAFLSSFEMKDISKLGLLKIDLLGLTELSKLKVACHSVGMSLEDLYNMPLDDELILEGFRDIDVNGIFQFEGDSTKSVLRQLPTIDFNQLVACITLSKPGPAHSGGTTKYIARARGDSSVSGFDWLPVLEEITAETYGQIIYQEQVLRVVIQIGQLGFDDANKIRIAMAKSQGEAIFESYLSRFKQGAVNNGLSDSQAEQLWAEIKTMGRWAFNKSHAVAYALVAWWSMYFKRHYPIQFYWANMVFEKNESMKFKILLEAQKKGFDILSPRIGKSGIGWRIEGNGLRAGLNEIKGIGDKMAQKLIDSGAQTKEDLIKNKVKGLGARGLEKLEIAGVFSDEKFDFFGLGRYDALDGICPDRVKLSDIKDWDKEYEIVVSGVFVEMNYKDVHEEMRSRGQSYPVRDPHIAKYAMLLLEDETDRCLVNVNRYVFNNIGQDIWDAYNNQLFVIVRGVKVDGWRIVRAKQVEFYSRDELYENDRIEEVV